MITNTQIESLVNQLETYQVKALLSEFYAKNEKNTATGIFNAINKDRDALDYDLKSLVESGEIDELLLITELNS